MNTSIEQCDSCVARATSIVCLSNGLKLFLCTHHTNEHKTALEADSATIYTIGEE